VSDYIVGSINLVARLTAHLQAVLPSLYEDCEYMFQIGLGYHNVTIDISQAIAELPSAMTRAEMLIMAPDESIFSIDVDLPILAARTTALPQFYTEDVIIPVGTETHTFLAVQHEFAQRGDYRATIRFWFGASEYVTTATAFRILAGDGFYLESQT